MEQISLLPVREFPDRGTKWLLESPENVFGLLQILDAEIANRLDYSRLQDQKTSFVLDSLRKQESDLLFLAPIKDTAREILIYILIEHQSEPVMSMGFRLLFYMTLVWDKQRREWERDKVKEKFPLLFFLIKLFLLGKEKVWKESEWRFHPILPVLFYTGESDWNTSLSVTALMDVPEEFERFVPSHETLFLNLHAIAPEQLTAKEHPFGWIARILKKEKAKSEALISELKQAVEKIDKLTVEQRIQWLRAIHYILLLIYHRREPEEHEQLTEIVLKSVQNRRRQEEVSQMGRTIAQAFIEEGEQRGREKGQIETTQSNTLDALNARFTLPYSTLAELKERIQRIEGLSVLQRLHIDAVKVKSLDDFVKRLDELQV